MALPASNVAATNPVLQRRERFASLTAPSKDYRRLSERLQKRQSIGGVGAVPANDNQAWPLAQWLRKDGSTALLRVAERYRAMYDAATMETPLIGTMPDDVFAVEQRHSVSSKTGRLKRDGPRRAKHTAIIGDGTFKVIPIDEDVRAEIESGQSTFKMKMAKPVMRRWQGDNLINAAIDSRVGIRRLQAALGPLLEPFEDAVLHGETLAAIGERKGGNSVSSAPIGRAFVMDGLVIVQRELSLMDRETLG